MNFFFQKFLPVILALVVAVLVIRSLVPFQQSAVVVSKETTAITAPLNKHRLPDYNAWLLERQRNATVGKPNGAIPFWQAMWPGDYDEEAQKLLRAELGDAIPRQAGAFGTANSELTTKFSSWLADHWIDSAVDRLSGEAKAELRWDAQQIAEESAMGLMGRPFTRDSLPIATAWIEKYADGFALLVKLTEYDVCYSPSPSQLRNPTDSLIATDIHFMLSARDAAYKLRACSSYYIGEQKYEQAWLSCLGIRRIAEFCNSDDHLVSFLTAVAIYGMFLDSTRVLLDRPGVSDELLARMEKDLTDGWQPLTADAAIDVGERLTVLDAVCRLAAGEPNGVWDDDEQFTAKLRRAPIDWNIVLRQANDCFDGLVAAIRHQNWVERRKAVDEWERRLSIDVPPKPKLGQLVQGYFSVRVRSQLFGNVLLNLFLPTLTVVLPSADRVNTDWDLTRIAVVLSRYQREHGKYPNTLADLVPTYVPAVPVDLFHQKPYVYRKTMHGFTIYSMGPNGTDDQGDSVMFHRLRGYELHDELDLPSICELLEGEVELPESDRELGERIAPSSDDVGIRFPIPERRLPASPRR